MSLGRIRVLAAVFFAAALFIIWRLFTWQVVHGEELGRIGLSQQKGYSQISSRRGAILANDGFALASSTLAWLVWAQPPDIGDPKGVSQTLAPLLAPEPHKADNDQEKEKERRQLLLAEGERLHTQLSKKDALWVPLKHRVDDQTKQEIEELKIPGVGFDLEEKRSYPEASIAAHLLGFVGRDAAGADRGYFGLEGRYDVALSGLAGEKSWEKDALGNPVLVGSTRAIAPFDGVDLVTHIDRSAQFIVDRHLQEGLAKYGAASGTVILMRPSDGAILALAVQPTYDPAEFSRHTQDDFLNPAISMTFEPGSVFKPFVMSAALDAGMLKPADKCQGCAGPVRIGPYVIGTWDDKYYPDSTVADIIKHSDNVGMVWVAQQLGHEKMHEYLSNFGIGSPSGIDLQGETTAQLAPWQKWGQIGLATASFGQGIAVTPIQLIRAAAAIANRGPIPTPQVVDRIVGNGWEEDIKPEVGKPVILPEAADKMTAMMVDATKAGEAKWAAPKGFSIAGKTGTAQIPVQGHYDTEKTIASFVGFAPACVPPSGTCQPKFVMLVTLREPTSSPWAAETAAPLWFTIARDLFLHFGIAPER